MTLNETTDWVFNNLPEGVTAKSLCPKQIETSNGFLIMLNEVSPRHTSIEARPVFSHEPYYNSDIQEGSLREFLDQDLRQCQAASTTLGELIDSLKEHWQQDHDQFYGSFQVISDEMVILNLRNRVSNYDFSRNQGYNDSDPKVSVNHENQAMTISFADPEAKDKLLTEIKEAIRTPGYLKHILFTFGSQKLGARVRKN